jgi:hypothetical protein
MNFLSVFILALHLGAFLCNCQDARGRVTSRNVLLGKGKTSIPSNYPSQKPSASKKKMKYVSSVPSLSTPSPSVSSSLKPSLAPTSKSDSPSRGKSSIPTVYATSRFPSNAPSVKQSTEKPSFMNSPNPSTAETDGNPTVVSSTPSSSPVASSAHPTVYQEPMSVSTTPSSSDRYQISPKPSLKTLYPSYTPTTNMNSDLCEIRNMTIGNMIGNSSIIKYTYEVIYNSTSNISELMSNVERSVMNGLLPIVDSCEGVRLSSNSIVGMSADPDDTILPDPCSSVDGSNTCKRIESRMTFFYIDSESFDALDILDRIKLILDSGEVEGRGNEIIRLQYVTNELIGGSGPVSDTNDDELQQKSVGKVPFYAWFLIAVGGFVGLGIAGNRVQRNFQKYREVDSIISNHAIE